MTDAEFTKICGNMLETIKSMTPEDTGNLKKDATLSRSLGNGIIEIYVDVTVAPYFKYVNNYDRVYFRKYVNDYSISGGKIVRRRVLTKTSVPNRNYKYFEKAFEVALSKLAEDANGRLEID
jgi:hypothetical protein